MAERRPLGEFEQLVLLAILHLEDDAYAVPVRRLIEQNVGRRVARGAVYTTLDRLEGKGLVRSWVGDPTPEPSGKAKRYYAVTRAGARAVRESRAALQRLWTGLERVWGGS